MPVVHARTEQLSVQVSTLSGKAACWWLLHFPESHRVCWLSQLCCHLKQTLSNQQACVFLAITCKCQDFARVCYNCLLDLNLDLEVASGPKIQGQCNQQQQSAPSCDMQQRTALYQRNLWKLASDWELSQLSAVREQSLQQRLKSSFCKSKFNWHCQSGCGYRISCSMPWQQEWTRSLDLIGYLNVEVNTFLPTVAEFLKMGLLSTVNLASQHSIQARGQVVLKQLLMRKH